MTTYNRAELAKAMAIAAHEACGQVRRFSGKPYWYHCAEVVLNVIGWRHLCINKDKLDDVICAAWLHDTVEDTKLGLETIDWQFGKNVAHIVDALTKVEKYGNTDLNATNQKLNCSLEARFIKLCDILANVNDAINECKNNPHWAKKFAAKKRNQVNYIDDFSPNSVLQKLIDEVYQKLASLDVLIEHELKNDKF